MKEGEGIKDTLIRVGKGGVAYQNTMKAHFGGLVEKFFPPLCFFLFALYIKRYSNVKRLFYKSNVNPRIQVNKPQQP